MSTTRHSYRLVLGMVALSTIMSCGGGGGGGGTTTTPTPTPNPNPTTGLLVTQILQDRTNDPSGTTAIFTFNRSLETSSASTAANYVASGGQNALAANLAANGSDVTVTFDAAILPGTTTFSVSEVVDVNGEKMSAASGLPASSTDTAAPTVTSSVATAIENGLNDVITLVFDDQMFASDLLNPGNLLLEHPVGVAKSLAGSTLSYNAGTQTLTILLDGASVPANLEFGIGWQISLSNVRDLGGNPVAAGVASSGTVAGDNSAPSILAVTQNTSVDPLGHTVDIAFSEVVDQNTASLPLNFVGNFPGGAAAALFALPVGGGDTVRVTFPSPVVPGQETLDVQGVEDLAGNLMSASAGLALNPDDSVGPTIANVTVSSVSGLFNDTISVVFDESVLPSGASTLGNYVVESPVGSTLGFGTGTQIFYDASTTTATIVLSSTAVELNLQTGASFRLTATNIRDVAGNALQSGPQTGTVTGDTVLPTLMASGVTQKTSINPTGTTVDVAFSECVSASAENPLNYASDGGQTAIWAVRVGGGDTARVTFDSAVPAGAVLTVSNVQDLAGNAMLIAAQGVVSDETLPPSILSITADAPANAQNDTITVQFNEGMMPTAAVDPSNFSVESPVGTPLTLDAFSLLTYNPATFTTSIVLSSPVTPANLQVGGGFKVTVNNVTDVSGNALPLVGNSVTGSVTGDVVAPAIVSATMVPTITKILEIEFSEQLDPASVAASTWTFSQFLQTAAPGAASLNSDGKTVRLVATFGNSAGQTINCSGIVDLAGNPIDLLHPAATIN